MLKNWVLEFDFNFSQLEWLKLDCKLQICEYPSGELLFFVGKKKYHSHHRISTQKFLFYFLVRGEGLFPPRGGGLGSSTHFLPLAGSNPGAHLARPRLWPAERALRAHSKVSIPVCLDVLREIMGLGPNPEGSICRVDLLTLTQLRKNKSFLTITSDNSMTKLPLSGTSAPREAATLEFDPRNGVNAPPPPNQKNNKIK